jgi:hypothetical protein
LQRKPLTLHAGCRWLFTWQFRQQYTVHICSRGTCEWVRVIVCVCATRAMKSCIVRHCCWH